MINPAPIPSELSLNAGDHDELKIFVESCLIPSQIDQKLKNKERVHGFLKKKLGLKLWMMEQVVSVGCGVVGTILWCGVLAPKFEGK